MMRLTCAAIVMITCAASAAFAAAQVSPTDPEASNWGASLQRPVGHNALGLPMLIYTHGNVGQGVTPDDRTEVRLVTFERE